MICLHSGDIMRINRQGDLNDIITKYEYHVGYVGSVMYISGIVMFFLELLYKGNNFFYLAISIVASLSLIIFGLYIIFLIKFLNKKIGSKEQVLSDETIKYGYYEGSAQFIVGLIMLCLELAYKGNNYYSSAIGMTGSFLLIILGFNILLFNASFLATL